MATSVAEATIRVNGIDLWYKLTGEGDLIAQVHGSTIGHINFAPVTPLLARSFQVLDFDQRGFGRTDKPLQDYTIETWADDLAALLDALGHERAHIHGTSMGGLIAIHFAAKYPKRTRGLILDCTLGRYDTYAHINKRVRKSLVAAYGFNEDYWNLAIVQDFSRTYIESDRAKEGIGLLKQSFISDAPREIFLAVSRAVEMADVVPLLRNVEAPTLVMVGQYDFLTPYEMGRSGAGGRALHEGIRGARLVELAGCGHINMFEEPDTSARAIVDFLASIR